MWGNGDHRDDPGGAAAMNNPTMPCPLCGGTISQDAQSCHHCGAVQRQLPPAPAPTIYRQAAERACPECAETIKAAARVCKHCGYRLDSGGISAGPNQVAAPPPQPTTVNVKQVNEGCFSGCAGIFGVIFLLVVFLRNCGG